MDKELRLNIGEEQYEQLVREAQERHEDPTVYAGRVLTEGLNRARFVQGCADFLSTPGMREEFALRFGPAETGTSVSAA
ncbi:hypothetical protein [Streptomyces beigongshangae]|uniref:hypothetical protein n=1 Tax=Streptomyces beigongshangae TaxID=2841597 RepID=UPI001C8502D6|nr:hypothetical protein [Streptomyces sp. REN17]